MDLLQSPGKQVQLILTDSPVLRQKVTEKKVNLVKYTQLLDVTDLAIRTVNAKRTNSLAATYSLLSDDHTFKGSAQQFALLHNLTFSECSMFCKFRSAEMLFNMSSLATLKQVFPKLGKFWFQTVQSSEMHGTTARYKLEVQVGDHLVEIFPHNKLSAYPALLYYNKHGAPTFLSDPDKVGLLYSWWEATGGGFYHDTAFHRLDTRIILGPSKAANMDDGEYNVYQLQFSVFEIILPLSARTVVTGTHRADCICTRHRMKAHNLDRSLRAQLEQSAISLAGLPFGVETARLRKTSAGITQPDLILDKYYMSEMNETDEYLTASHLWPLVINQSTVPAPGKTDMEEIEPRTLALHPLAVAGMKVTALGLSYLMEDSIDTMKALANEHMVVEFHSLQGDAKYREYPTFEAYMNADDDLVRYHVSDDKIAVHLAGSAPPSVTQGQTLASHQVTQLATEADRLCYYRDSVASHVPQMLLQRLLHDNQIKKNRVPGSAAVYEITSGQSFSIINIYLQMFSRGDEMAVYKFHPLPFAAIDNQIFLSYKASEIKVDIADYSHDISAGTSSEYTCHLSLMTEKISSIKETCEQTEHKLPLAEEVFPQANGSFLITLAGVLHAICDSQPPVTMDLEYNVQLLYIPGNCRISILYKNGLSYLQERISNNSHDSRPPLIVLQYNVEFHATTLDKIHLRSVINSALFALVCAVIAISVFSAYKLMLRYRMRLIRGNEVSALEFYPRADEERVDTPETPALCLQDDGNPFLQGNSSPRNMLRQERRPDSPLALHYAMESAVHAAELCINDNVHGNSSRSTQNVAQSEENDADTENNFITSCKSVQTGKMHAASNVKIWPPASHSTV